MNMKLGLIGIGNMGLGWLGAALRAGHSVMAVDRDPAKVNGLKDGSLLRGEEKFWPNLLASAGDRLGVTTDLWQLSDARIVFVAVQTPRKGSHCNYAPLLRLLTSLRGALSPGQILLLGSTVFPGAIAKFVLPVIDDGIEFAYEPVFLRAGTSVSDYAAAPKVVAGVADPDNPPEALAEFFATTVHTVKPAWCTYDEAEFIKVIHNAFMCVKVSFGNELGRLCRSFGVDPRRVADLAFTETGPNARLLSTSHMTPGPPYSGTCLPKDSEILAGLLAGRDGYQVMQAAVWSNDDYVDRIVSFIGDHVGPSGAAGCIGITYVPGYTDPRESLFARLRIKCHAKDVKVLGHDPMFAGLDDPTYAQYCRGNQFWASFGDDVTLDLPTLLKRVSVVVVNRPLMSTQRALLQDSKLPFLDLYQGWHEP
jgi:GDP-mannose 6-dehydrogenase